MYEKKLHQAEAQVREDAPMLGHALEQARMPPAALLDQVAQIVGRLAPADGVGRVLDQVVLAVRPAEHVQLRHQLHVLAHRVAVVAPARDHIVLAEHPEGARDDEVAVELVEQDAGGKERPVVLQHLHGGDDLLRQRVVRQAAVLDLDAVGQAHEASHSHHVLVFDDRRHDLAQRVVLQHGIGVDADEVRVLRCVDPHVERVGLAAVFLGDERDGNALHAPDPHALLRLAGNLQTDGAVDGAQAERVDDDLRRVVGGAVVHHDDLVKRVVQRQKRAHRAFHRDVLVVRRHDDADGHIAVHHDAWFW